MKKHKEKNNCVYVHCKAGRYRSALIVACYLIHNNPKLTTDDVIKQLTLLRPNVILQRKRQIDAINEYKLFLKS
jgi:protein-tyrosine phosphatase